MSSVILRTGYDGPGGPVAECVANAFNTLAVSEWLVPDDAEERARLMAGQFEMLVETALNGGGYVDAAFDDADRLVGATVWFDLTHGTVEPPAGYERRLAELCGPHSGRFVALDEAFERHHPDPGANPHQHLAFCAVDPDRRGQGVGTLLLRQGLDRLDKTGAAGYLEAADLPLTEWYGRNGFLNREPLRLPDGPFMYPMWRDPVPIRPSA